MTDVGTTIVKAVQTCYAFPSAWDVWTDNGVWLYLKYRYGKASVWIYSEDEYDELESSMKIGDRRDGLITLENFCEATGFTLDLHEPYRPMPDPNEGVDITASPAWAAEEPDPPIRTQVLRVAEKLVCRDREDQYGAPAVNLQRIANYWNTYLADVDGLLTPRNVAFDDGADESRAGAAGHKRDSMIDIAGYAAIGAEAAESGSAAA